MVVRKRKRNTRMRGSHTHGWGAKKKHRGAGNRGGRGFAGTGKRADQMKTLHWKERYFGKFGFKPKGPKEEINAINIQELEEKSESLLKNNLIEKKDNLLVIDLQKLGYNKLLSNGRVTKKMKIIAKYASEKAVEKLNKANCELILSKEQ